MVKLVNQPKKVWWFDFQGYRQDFCFFFHFQHIDFLAVQSFFLKEQSPWFSERFVNKDSSWQEVIDGAGSFIVQLNHFVSERNCLRLRYAQFNCHQVMENFSTLSTFSYTSCFSKLGLKKHSLHQVKFVTDSSISILPHPPQKTTQPKTNHFQPTQM